MSCRTFRQQISLSFDEPLTGAQHLALEAHVAACPACRQLWQAMFRLDHLFESAPPQPAPAGFAQRVLAQLHAQQRRQRPRAGGIFLAFGSLSVAGAGALPALLAVGAIIMLARLPATRASLMQVLVAGWLFVTNVGAGLLTASGALATWLSAQPALPALFGLAIGLSVVWVQLVRKLSPEVISQ